MANLSSAFPCFSIFLIEFIQLNDLRKEIAFLFWSIKGREICYTAGRQVGRKSGWQPWYGLYNKVALVKNKNIWDNVQNRLAPFPHPKINWRTFMNTKLEFFKTSKTILYCHTWSNLELYLKSDNIASWATKWLDYVCGTDPPTWCPVPSLTHWIFSLIVAGNAICCGCNYRRYLEGVWKLSGEGYQTPENIEDPEIFQTQIFLDPQFFWTQNSLNPKFVWTQILL